MILNTNNNVLIILINKVKNLIRKDLKERYCIALMDLKLDQFKNDYLLEDVLGKLEGNDFIINI